MRPLMLHPLAIAALTLGMTAATAHAQERYVYHDGYSRGVVYGYGPVYGYRPPVDAYVLADEYGPSHPENRALGTYVPRSDENLRESRRFFRGITRQSGGN